MSYCSSCSDLFGLCRIDTKACCRSRRHDTSKVRHPYSAAQYRVVYAPKQPRTPHLAHWCPPHPAHWCPLAAPWESAGVWCTPWLPRRKNRPAPGPRVPTSAAATVGGPSCMRVFLREHVFERGFNTFSLSDLQPLSDLSSVSLTLCLSLLLSPAPPPLQTPP